MSLGCEMKKTTQAEKEYAKMKQENSRLESGINIGGKKNILRKFKKAQDVSSCAASVPNFSPS